MSRDFLSQLNIQPAIIPVDLATGANNGDWVSLKNFNKLAVVVFKAAGIAGDDPIITLKQATDVAGTGAKALNFERIYARVGVQTGIGVWTKVTQAAGNTYQDAVSAEAQGLFMIEIDATDLDVNNGFDCVQLSIPDVGAGGAQLGCALYILGEPRNSPNTSAIVD